jgi:hypothetical protein
MSDVATNKECQKCGGEITTDQIIQKAAGLVNGILMCPACVDEKRKELIAAQQRAMQAAAAGGPAQPAGADDKLMLIDEAEMTQRRDPPKIMSFSQGSTIAGAHNESNLKRSLSGASEPATRCRSFHSKLTPAALAHMDDLINEWIDQNQGIYIKYVSTTVGPFEAKHVEQHLIVTVFY